MAEFDIKSLWPDWEIVRLIGEGSFGKVYEIVRNNFGIEEHSAMKVIQIPSSQAELQSLRNEGMDDHSATTYYRGLVEEFVQEIALMTKLKGKANIVGYEDYAVIEHKDTIGWDIVIRMELLTDLPSYMRRHTFCLQDMVNLARDLCTALEICHAQRIIHRDIKPDNIFVSENGDFKLGDFGVARTVEKTVAGLSKKGTYTYMAPEVYKGEEYGMDVDLYSLGIVMYKLLNNNREPFVPLPPAPLTYTDKSAALTRRLGGEDIPMPASATIAPPYEQLARIAVKACSFKPADRYQTPSQMKADLNRVQAAPVSPPVPDTPIKPAKHSSPPPAGDKTFPVRSSPPPSDDKTLPVMERESLPPAKPKPTPKPTPPPSETAASPKNGKLVAATVLGWIGLACSIVFAIIVFPYTITQTLLILISMIFLTARKGVKGFGIVMLISSILSLSLINILAAIIALNAKPTKRTEGTPPPPPVEEPSVCKYCGSALPKHASFCGKCGTSQI